MDVRYIKAKELSAGWGVTPRRINQLCADGKLPGAYKEGKFWMIPDDVDRPDCLREKSYTANLEKHGVSGIGMFGVAFSGKKMSVAYEEYDVKKRKTRE